MATINLLIKKIDMEYYRQNRERLLDEVYPERREKIVRLKNKRAAVVSLAAGIELQNIIALNCHISSKDISISYNKNGKPRLENMSDFYFNISHSDDMLAISYGEADCGIDIEGINSFNEKVSERCFTRAENEYIKGINDICAATDKTLAERFTRIWTMKEAYLKYTGTGISVPLNSFSVNPHEGCIEGTDVKLFCVQIKEYILSVCTKKCVTIIHDLS